MALVRVQASGYHYVEYSHVSHCAADEVEAIVAATCDIGLLPWSMHAVGQLNPAKRQEWLQVKARKLPGRMPWAAGC